MTAGLIVFLAALVGGLLCLFGVLHAKDAPAATYRQGLPLSNECLLMLAGVVIGGFIGSIASSVPGLDWLNYGQAFGLENPLVLSMGLVVLTFGLTIKITIAGIIGIALAILIYRWI